MHEKNRLVKNFKNWNFFNFDRSSIDRTSIELNRKLGFENLTFSIDRKIDSINWDLDKQNFVFWKTGYFSVKSIFKRFFMTCNAWEWFQKIFKTHYLQLEFSNKVFDFSYQKFEPTLKEFCIKHHKVHNLGWPN